MNPELKQLIEELSEAAVEEHETDERLDYDWYASRIHEYIADNSDERMVLRASCIMYTLWGTGQIVTIERVFEDDERLSFKNCLEIFEDDPQYFDVKQFKGQLMVEELK